MTNHRYWFVARENSFEITAGDQDPPKGAVEVDRLPGPFETIVDGEWIVDTDRKIDAEHLAKHGRDAIERAHAAKAIEAMLILAGVPVDGLIAAEAKVAGVDPIELAKTIDDKAKGLRRAELSRRRAKLKARAS